LEANKERLMEDVKTPDEKIRKTITMTHKQAGVGGISITAMFAALHFMSANYATRSDVKYLSEQAAEIKTIVSTGFDKQSRALADYADNQITTHR
jgi:hypothetical protein